MKIFRRKIILIPGVLIIIGAGLWGANLWVESKVRSFLDQKVEKGKLQYESLTANIFTAQASIKNVQWTDPKTSHKPKKITFSQLEVSNFSFAKYVLSKEIEIGKIQLEKPQVTFYPPGTDTLDLQQIAKEKTSFKEVLIRDIEIKNGTFQYFKEDTTQSTLSFHIPNLTMEDIRIDSTTLAQQSIPFQYGKYDLSANSFFYRMSDLYDLEVKSVVATNNHINLDSLYIKSPYSKYKFQSHIPHEKAWVNLGIPKIEVADSDWDLNQDTIAFSATNVKLTDADLYLYKDNRLADNPYFKPLYSRLIRNLPVKLDVDSVDITNAIITFQMQTKKDPPPGNVYFREVNGRIANVTNIGMDKPKFPKTVISADARFMKESRIHLDWSFDISNPRDDFVVSGTLSRIEADGINYFIKPALNISAEGAIDRLAFNFAGNNAIATGDMYIKYDALRINLLKKDGTKRSRWISAILNFILRNRLNGPVEKKGLKVKRVQTKSFWNYLWEMVKEGTLKTIM